MTVARGRKKSATTAHGKATAIEIVIVREEKMKQEAWFTLAYHHLRFDDLVQTSESPVGR